MSTLEATNIAVVRRYFDGCNSGKLRIFCPLSHRTSCTIFCLQAFQPYMGQSTWQGIGANSMTHAGHSGASMKSSGRVTASLASGVASGLRRTQDGKSCPVVLNGTLCTML